MHQVPSYSVAQCSVSRLVSKSLILVPQTPSVFIRTHNETLSVVAVSVNYPDCSPFGING